MAPGQSGLQAQSRGQGPGRLGQLPRLVGTHQKRHPFSPCHSCPKAVCLRRPGCGVTAAPSAGASAPRPRGTLRAQREGGPAGPPRPLRPQRGSRGAVGPPSLHPQSRCRDRECTVPPPQQAQESAWRLAGPESQVGAVGPSTGRGERTRWPQASSGRAWAGHLGHLTHVFLEAGCLCSQAPLRPWLVSPPLGRAAPRSKAWCSCPRLPRKRQQTEHLGAPGHRGLQDKGARGTVYKGPGSRTVSKARAPRWGPGRRGAAAAASSAVDRHAQQRSPSALVTRGIHPGSIHRMRRGSDQRSGTTGDNADTPTLTTLQRDTRGFRACAGPTDKGVLLAAAPRDRGLWGLPPPRHSTSELEAVPTQLLRILCPKPRSVRVCFLSIPDAISELPRHFTSVTFDSDLSECFSSPEKPVRAPALSDSVEGEGS